MVKAKIDNDLFAWYISGQETETSKEPEKSELFIHLNPKEAAPVKEESGVAETKDANPSHNILSLQEVRPCGFYDFISVICASFSHSDHSEIYEPYTQLWFTAEEAAEKCTKRGYQITAPGAQKFLEQLKELTLPSECRGRKNLIVSRYNEKIEKIEYRRVKLHSHFLKKYLGIEIETLKEERGAPLGYRERWGRNMPTIPLTWTAYLIELKASHM